MLRNRTLEKRFRLACAAACVGLGFTTPLSASVYVYWDSPASGSWSEDGNWSTGSSPNNGNPAGVTYRAAIDATGTPYSVLFHAPSAVVTVESLHLDSSDALLSLTAGTLTATNGLTVDAGTFRLQGATLSNLTLSGSGGMVDLYSGVLQGVTLARDAGTTNNNPFYATPQPLTVRGGMTMMGATFTLTKYDAYQIGAGIRFDGDQTISGTGAFSFQGDRSPSVQVTGGTLTIGAGVSFYGSAGVYFSGNDIVNYGTVRADPANLPFVFGKGAVTDVLYNRGLLLASSGAVMSIESRLDNTLGVIRADGGWVSIGSSSTDAPGVSTAELGTLEAINGGGIGLRGPVSNVARTLTSNSLTGSLDITSSAITGGTLATADGAEFTAVASTTTLTEVTLTGTIALRAINYYSGAILKPHDLTFDGGTIKFYGQNMGYGANAALWTDGNQTLAGTGLLIFEGNNTHNGIRAMNGVMTLSPGITVQTGSGGGDLEGNIVSQGLVSAETAGQRVRIVNGTTTNQGTIQVINGSSLTMHEATLINQGLLTVSGAGSSATLDRSWSNAGTIAATGATLDLRGTWSSSGLLTFTDATVTTAGSWSAPGAWLVNNSTLNLGGTFTLPGPMTRSGGSVKILGTLTNSPTSLSLDADTGSWELHSGGRIVGGTISTAAGAKLIGMGGTIDSADLLGSADVPAAQKLTLSGSTIHGLLTASTGSTITASGTSNAGAISVNGGAYNASGNWTNSGTISAVASAVSLSGTWINSGTISLSDSTAHLSGVWSSPGTIFATNTVLNVAGTINGPVSMVRTGGAVRIGSALLLTPGALTLDSGAGSWELVSGGKLLGGTINTTGTGVLTALGGSIEQVDILGHVDVPAFGSVQIKQSTLHGLLTVSTAATAMLSDTGVAGAVSVSGGLAGISGNWTNTGQIRADNGLLYLGGVWTNSQQITVNGGTFSLAGAWTNNGSIDTVGSTVLLGGTAVTIGSVTFRDSAVSLVASYTTAQLEQMNFPGSTLVVASGGTVVNTDDFLDINPTLPLQLGGGAIVGGWITTTGLALTATSGGFYQTVIAGQVNVAPDGYVDFIDTSVTGTVSGGAGSTSAFSGNYGNGGAISTNGGTLSFSGTLLNYGQILSIDGNLNLTGSWSSNGTIGAHGGALLLGGAWTNTGIISALAADITLAGSSAGIGTVSFTNSNAFITGSYTTTQLEQIDFINTPVVLMPGGAIQNAGDTLTINAALPLQFNGGSVVGGTIATAASPAAIAAGATVLFDGVTIDTDVTVAAGATLHLQGAWDNNATITATQATLALAGTYSTGNIGTLQRTGGTVRLSGSLDNTGSTLTVDDIGSWQLSAGTITGGTLAIDPDTALEVAGLFTSSRLVGVAIESGTLRITSNTMLDVRNGLTLGSGTTAATIVHSGTQLSFTGAQTLGGTGTLVLDGPVRQLGPGAPLTIGSGITVVSGTRNASLGGPTNSRIVNEGTVSSRTSGKTITASGWFTNNGTVEALNGGGVILPAAGASSGLTNYSAGTLTGGRWRVYDDSAISISGGATITTNAADVLLSGTGSSFSALQPLALNQGALAFVAGRDFITTAGLTSTGRLTLGAGSDLTVLGDLTLGENAETTFLLAEYDGPITTEGYGQVQVSGTATLDGTLELSRVDFGFTVGDQFTLLSATSVVGQFASVEFSPGIGGDIIYTPNSVEFHVTAAPEPGTLAVGLLGAGALLRRRRRRAAGSVT